MTPQTVPRHSPGTARNAASTDAAMARWPAPRDEAWVLPVRRFPNPVLASRTAYVAPFVVAALALLYATWRLNRQDVA